jgi:hypothetical protein
VWNVKNYSKQHWYLETCKGNTKVTTNISEWWDVTPCSFIEVYQLSVCPNKRCSRFIRNTITFIPKLKGAGSIPARIRVGFVFEMLTLDRFSLVASMLPCHYHFSDVLYSYLSAAINAKLISWQHVWTK